jgi:hypothetical protein
VGRGWDRSHGPRPEETAVAGRDAEMSVVERRPWIRGDGNADAWSGKSYGTGHVRVCRAARLYNYWIFSL